MSQGPSNQQILVHQVGQTFVWIILVNINIILAQIRQSYFAAKVHMMIGLIIFFLTYFFILWFLIPFGFIQSQKDYILYYLHAIIGCAMLGFVLVLSISGLITRYFKDKKLSNRVKKAIKTFHKATAYFLIVLFKINILWNWYFTNKTTFSVLVAWETICLILWVYQKFFSVQLELVVIDIKTKFSSKSQLKLTETTNDIKYLEVPYVIYNNHVYNASAVLRHHPGGQKVIKTILGREVDRFLYGMYSAELCPEIPTHSHSTAALKLLGQPLMRIATPTPYAGFNQSAVTVKVQFVNELSHESRIYLLGLVPQKGEFEFRGYSQIQQLGQYYSLTLAHRTTRLYTAVNFLTRSNIVLLNTLLPSLKFGVDENKIWSQEKYSIELSNLDRKKIGLISNQQKIINLNYLPLMIKSYENGKFSSLIRKSTFKDFIFQLSQPKGFGLELDTTKPGNIIIVAGGTGLFPFSDFIDLYFKSVYLQQSDTHRELILNKNPILRLKPFQKYTFLLLASANKLADINQVTISQLQYLAKNTKKFKTILRISKHSIQLKQQISDIQFTQQYFTSKVLSEGEKQNCSRIWICGPPKMSEDLGLALQKHKISQKKILFI